MAERKQRDVEELYSATDLIQQPEITPVLKGRCRMQGPGDEADTDSKNNSGVNEVPSPDVKGFGGPLMSQKKVNITAESGTCNVCSAPCTSCMHLNQALMGSKRKEYSDETCLDGVASQYSANDCDILRPFNGASEHSPQGTADETSHPQGFNSRYSCDNTKNQPASTDASGALEDVSTVRKLFDRAKPSETYLPPKPCTSAVEINISNEDCKPVEGQDDNISCVSSGNDLNSRVNNVESCLDRKVDPSSSVSSGNLCPEGTSVSIQGAGERKDNEISLGDFKSLNEDDQVKKLTHTLETAEVPDPSPRLLPEDESEGSDILEQDVKVCDICGDAGREDLLAICSRCSDGAEHTYCMREMLQKVPEGDWVCEECKSAYETESQKAGIEGKTSSRVTSASQVPDKSLVENIEVSPTVKAPGSSKLCGSTGRVTPSRDSSFNNHDNGVKLARQMSCTSSVQDFPEGARSPLPSNLRSKGALLKSNSFNAFISKPKVKVIDEGLIQKHKGIRENSSSISKEGPIKAIGKSMSFKHPNPGRPVAVDAKVKMLPTKLTHAQNTKGSRNLKEGNVFDRTSLRKLDRNCSSVTRDSSTPSTPNSDQKPTSCGESLQGITPSNNRDSKLAQADVKSIVLPKSAEYKSNQLDQKEEPLTSTSRTMEKHCIEGNGLRHDGLSRSKGSANHTDRGRDCSVGRSKQAVINGSKSIFCQRCKEVGHDADSCPVSSLQGGIEVSMTRSTKEETYNSSKIKTPITSAMLKKPGIYRRNKGPEKSEDLSVSNPTHVDPLSFPDVLKKVMSAGGPYEGQAVRQSCTSDARLQMIGNSVMQLTGQQKGACSLKGPNLDFNRHSEGSSSSHSPCTSVFPSAICRISAIPEHECIWKGSFEVCRGVQQPDFCGGLQAHLSTLASPRVLEMVKKFSHKIFLSEVPRICTWPTQFNDCGAQDDNIALYFFAEDPESFERSYKGLLEKMIKNDLALKASFDGVDLLIFPSNQLPEKSQRWNTLFYLWGVFRGRSVPGVDQQCGSSLKSTISTSNVMLAEKNIPPVVPSSNKLSLPKCNGRNLPPCGKSCQRSSPSWNPILSSSQITPSSMAMNGNCHLKETSIDKMCICLKEASIEEDSGHDSRNLHGSFTSSDWSKQQNKCPQTSQNEACGLDAIVPMELQQYVTPGAHGSAEDDKKLMQRDTSPNSKGSLSHSLLGGIKNGREQEMHGTGNEVKLDRVLKEEDQLMDRGATLEVEPTTLDVLRHLQHQKKRQHSDLVETASQTSFVTSEIVAWNNVNSENVKVDYVNKKQKTDSSKIYGASRLIDATLVDGFASQKSAQDSTLAVVKKVHDKACDETINLENSGTAERFFFPVISNHVKDLASGESSMWKMLPSPVPARSHDGVPNLDLALGAKTKSSNKGLPPLWTGVADKSDGNPEVVASQEEDPVSGSLSLSLSFPFPDSDKGFKPVPETEQPLPESRHVNTSLLLFGDFSDK